MIRIRGTAETRRCDADAVRKQVITWNPALTLCASHLPLPPPPPAPPPLSQTSSLIVTLINLARGIQGCPKIIFFDKSNWHPDFWRAFSVFLFLCFAPAHFSQHPLPKKCTPFFPSVANPRNLLPAFFLCYNFSPFLNKCHLFMSKDFETSLLTLLGVSLVLWRRERLITSKATPGFIAPRP